jgi:hypothetical protein
MTPPVTSKTLEYECPSRFYTGEIRFRNRQVSGVGGLAVGSAGVAFAVAWAVGSSVDAARPLAFAACAFGAICAGLGGYLLWLWATDHRQPVRVTADGIECGRRRWGWSAIAWLGATRHHDGCAPTFALRGRTGHRVHLLPVSPRLSAAEYATLAAAVREHVRPSFPHVEVRDPQPPTDDEPPA